MVLWLSFSEMYTATRVQILDEIVCMSLMKDMDQTTFPPAMGKLGTLILVWQPI